MRTLRITAAALLAVVALSACAQGGDGTTATPTQDTGSPVTTDFPPSPADPTMPADPGNPGGTSGLPPATAGTLTLTGTVTPGVEPGCLLIDGYLLVDGPRDVLRAGNRVTVTGRVEPDLMTTCQQGTPLRVQSAKRA
ncbi:hypothetical protein [Micromonospora echinofusca]|uniref:Uncharacterized protein n=1 Tax=Micromonospora echinofusca TaxID=47858 RepID=A0ABS3VVS8_MICEH|nr:hypothetical protein [Micromonospora echinofusca]MBO4208504.1 hypothetical protein [Micromonospora echinofusca]